MTGEVREKLNRIVRELVVVIADIADAEKRVTRLQQRAWRLYKKLDGKLDRKE